MATGIAAITTAQQLLDAPDLGRCELVRGELIMMSPAGSRHGMIVSRINFCLEQFVRERSLGVVFGGDTGFHLRRDPDTVRAPDVGFVRAERVPGELPHGFFDGPPDLAVEVLSPNDRASEVLAKVQDWLDAGCLAIWVVDPDGRTVRVYDSHRRATLYRDADTLPGGDVLPGFAVPVADLFGRRPG